MAALSVVSAAQAALAGRDINGVAVAGSDASAVFLYDTLLDITWLRNADVNGRMTWNNAKSWAAGLTVGSYSGWRLPTVEPVNGSFFNSVFSNNGTTDAGFAVTGTGWGTASEMGHLFYVTLGNKGFCTPNAASPQICAEQPGWDLVNTGDFQNLQPFRYWSGTQVPNLPWAWAMDYNTGRQSEADWFLAFEFLHAMAVHPGDVLTPVPEPQTLALMLMGMSLLAVASRKRPV